MSASQLPNCVSSWPTPHSGGGEGDEGGRTHTVCALLAHGTAAFRIPPRQHLPPPPGRLEHAAPPQAPQEAAQQTLLLAKPHAQKDGASAASAAAQVGCEGGDAGGGGDGGGQYGGDGGGSGSGGRSLSWAS